MMICFSQSFGQKDPDSRLARQYFDNGNYIEAIPEYEKLLMKAPANIEFNHKLGICYLRSNIDKTKARQYLEQSVKSINAGDEAYYDLGLAYMYNYQFDEAIKSFSKYKADAKGNNLDKIDRQLENCRTAKQLIELPHNVTFENLGPDINTSFPDYYPFVAKDESFLVFTSRRKGCTGNYIEFDGYYSSDIWISTFTDGTPGKARNAGSMVNSDYDEQAVGLSDDATTLFIYEDKIKEFGDIYISYRKSRGFLKSEKMGENVNSSHLETAASISADGNTLFFASDRPGGQGGLDIYMTRMLPTGEWALPQNLGPKINSIYHEDFPTLSADGKTLYFCSNGHISMGGYDIFSSKWDQETNTWSSPKNLGYPINTPEDNFVISFTEDGRQAYISALRKEGYGDLDIYRITFNDTPPSQVIYKFKVVSSDTLKPSPKNTEIEIIEKHGSFNGQYLPNIANGSYTIILQPGKYVINIEPAGFKAYTNDLEVKESDVKKGIIDFLITLNPE